MTHEKLSCFIKRRKLRYPAAHQRRIRPAPNLTRGVISPQEFVMARTHERHLMFGAPVASGLF